MAKAITDIDNHESFRNIFDIIENNSQLLREADYISIMKSVSDLRLDIKKSIKLKCSCSGTNFCIQNMDAFLACSNISYALKKCNVLKLLLPLHKRNITSTIHIHFFPNIKDIIIDYSFIDFETDSHEITEFLDKIIKLINTKPNRITIIVLFIVMFDTIFKHFIIFKNAVSSYNRFWDMMKRKLGEFANDSKKDMKYIKSMINFKGNIFNEFLQNLELYS